MTLRQTIQAAPGKTAELITKLSATSNQALKTREGLFAQLSDELTHYITFEEQHFLPLLRKHADTKGLAADSVKANKELGAALVKLSAMPKDNDAFLAELDTLNKSFQQYVRNERKELLPAVLKALSDEEAGASAANIDDAVSEAEKATRDAKRAEVADAKRRAEETEQAAAADRAAVRSEKAAERTARKAVEQTVDTVARGAAAAKDVSRAVTATISEQAQTAVSDTQEAMTVYSEASQKVSDDLQAVRASSAITTGAATEIYSAWMDWFGKTTRTNAEAAQQMMQCRTLQQVATSQQEFVTNALQTWIEGNATVLKIVQHTSKQALGPLDSRLSEVA
ncbi:hemerythrin domain-containing protein [Loktanella sp. DJP18]|uniref:hemerythrin domain-containing protein n=1 Tax=Loktanella sp. DJP18 TaxID=3409788 RepID=UPI003BB531B1